MDNNPPPPGPPELLSLWETFTTYFVSAPLWEKLIYAFILVALGMSARAQWLRIKRELYGEEDE